MMYKKEEMQHLMVVLSIISVACISLCGSAAERKEVTRTMPKHFMMASSAFKYGADIPSLYTCDGENVSPDLKWANAPTDTQSFVLICFDPDAPGKGWVHWILFDIPASILQLPRDVQISAISAKIGINSWGKAAYGGACPPQGKHRYIFTLYALDIPTLSFGKIPNYHNIMQAMKHHIIGQTNLIGKYQRLNNQ